MGALALVSSTALAQIPQFQPYGGRILAAPIVVHVLYGSGSYLSQVTSSTPTPSMSSFFTNVLNSPYLDWLNEYNTFGTSTDLSQTVQRGELFTELFTGQNIFTITPSPARDGSLIADSDIQAELSAQIVSGNLPYVSSTDGNTDMLYVVFFPSGKTIVKEKTGAESCSSLDDGFCAYHGVIPSVSGHGEAYYVVVPDSQESGGESCFDHCLESWDTQLDKYTQVVSHEILEAITDPQVMEYTGTMPPPSNSLIAWYYYNASPVVSWEIADACSPEGGTILGADGNSYEVAKAWSNVDHQTGGSGCIVQRSPPTKFVGGPTNAWWNAGFYGGAGLTFLADVNGDRRGDLVTMGSGYVGVIQSTGGVSQDFGSYQTWLGSTASGAEGTLVGPLSYTGGNSHPPADIVTLNASSVTVRRSNESGFGASTTWWSAGFYGGYGTFLADVTGDGYADLVAAGAGYVGVIPSTGSAFGTYATWSGDFHGADGTFAADVNHDGRADMIAVNSSTVSVQLSTGSAFSTPTTWYTGTAYGTNGVLVGDVNGDGYPDLVVLNSANVSVLLNSGSSFAAPVVWFTGTFYGTQGTLIGDINGDGFADVVALNASSVDALIASK